MKNSIKSVGQYLRELSIIVSGVAITLIAGLYINNRNNEKDIELYLENIKLELQKNIEDINDVREYYNMAAHYSEYLLTNNMQNLHPDTLNKYSGLTKALPFFTYKSSAFDMFKTSGVMRLIKDKNKVMSIWNSYDALEFLKMSNDFYIQRKVTVIENLNGFAKGNVEQEQLFGFYTNGMAENWAQIFAYSSEHIEKAIAQLED